MRKYIQFIVSRLIGTAVDTAVLWLCSKYLFSTYFGTVILSPMISFEFAVMSNFLCSYYWIWSNRIENKAAKSFFQHFWKFNLSSLVGFLVKMVFLIVFERLFGWSVVVCNLVALTISGVLNYFLAESVVFRKRYRRPKRELLSIEEVCNATPLFRGDWGKHLAEQILRLCGIDRFNRLYDSVADFNGAECANRALDTLSVDYLVGNPERLDKLPEGAFITISNHPYGGLDGVILVDLFCGLRDDYKVMVNDILGRIEPMREVFITVTPTGNVHRAATAVTLGGIRTVVERLRGGHPVGFFPSGAVSDLHLKQRNISDREWQQGLIHIIKKAKVPIVPVRFFDRNSMFYYSLGLIDWRVRILRLPRELFNKHKSPHRVGIGATIDVAEQERFADIDEFGAFLRDKIYGMPVPEHFTRRSAMAKKSPM